MWLSQRRRDRETPLDAPDAATGSLAVGPSVTARGVVWVVGATLFYIAVAVLYSLPVWGDPEHIIFGHGGDEQLTMSFFSLIQHSLATLHNPFFTTYLNAPHGVNLAWETTSPLLAVIAWPFDAVFGPVLGFNLLCTAAFALTGLSAYLAISQIVHSRVAGLVAGLLFAFCPFMDVHGSLGQLELSFLVTPPLLALTLRSLLCGNESRWVRHGLWLAALLVAQFYISIEVLFIEVLFCIVVVVVAAVMNRGTTPSRIVSLCRAVGLAALISVACTAFPLYVMFTYPYRPMGTVQPSFAFPTDALNLITPTFLQLIAPSASSPVTSGFDGGDLAEATGYIGLPMLMVVACVLVWLRRDRLVVTGVIVGAVAVIASLGGHLHVGGKALGVPLPWLPFLHLPIFEQILPARFSFVVDLVLAMLAAALIVEAMRRRGRLARVAVAGLIILAICAFAPERLDTSVPPQPRFFTSDASRIPAGATVLLAPLPFDFSVNAELWQADSKTRFRILGGYIHGSEAEHPATIPVLAAALQSIEQGQAVDPMGLDVGRVRAELQQSGVRTVILGPDEHDAALRPVLTAICGGDGVSDQGVEVWWSCV